MLLKKQLLSQQNLNNAYLSLINTQAQSIQSNLTVSGGALTLKTSLFSDNANTGQLRISPQGNNLVLYNGASNQQLSIYSSSGTENTYITTINQANNLSYGLIDVAGSSVAQLNINSNSNKPVYFGGTITPNPASWVVPSGTTTPPVFRAIGPSSDFRITVQDGSARSAMTWNSYWDNVAAQHKYIVSNEQALRLQFDSVLGFELLTATTGNANGIINWTTGLVNGIDGTVKIGTTTGYNGSSLVVYKSGDNWHTTIGDVGAGVLKIGGNTNNGAVIQAYNQATSAVRDLYLQRDGGYVGIGTNSPAGKFHVAEANYDLKTGGDHLTLQSNANMTTTFPYLEFRNNSGTRGMFLGWGSNSGKYVQMTLENGYNLNINGGNIGIETSSPENSEGWYRVIDLLGVGNAKSSVRTANIDSRIMVHDSGWFGAPSGMIIGTKTNHAVSIATNASSRLTISTAGNLGVNTTSPATKLHVYTGASTTNDGILTASPNKSLYMLPDVATGSYNQLNNGGGQTSIVYAKQSADDINGNIFTIAPWSGYNGGLSMNGQGFMNAGTFRQTVIPLTGGDGPCLFGNLDNHYAWLLQGGGFMYFKFNNIGRLTNGTTGRPMTWVIGIVCNNGSPYDGATIQIAYNSGSGGWYKTVNMTGTIPTSSLGTVKVLTATVSDFNPSAMQNLGADWRINSPANPANGNFGVIFAVMYDSWTDCFHTFEAYPGAAGPYWSRIAGQCNARGARMVIPVGTNMYAS
jgi:hypothetical protein